MARPPFRDFLHQGHGNRLRVRVDAGRGDDIPLLVCGGFGVPLDVLDGAVAALGGTTVIRFDPPGIGGSRGGWRPYRFGHLARDLVGILDALGLDQVDVYGISWGGMVAQQFAIQYPQRCRNLILAATMAGVAGVPGNPLLGWAFRPARWFVGRGRPSGGTLHAQGWRGCDVLGRAVRDGPGCLGQMLAICGWTSIHRLHQVSQPTLLIYGKEDTVVPLVNGRLLQRAVPDARLVVLDCGHLFPLTRSQGVAAEILRFRSEQDGAQESRKHGKEKTRSQAGRRGRRIP